MRTEDGGIFVGLDEGKSLPNPVGGRIVVKVRDEDTAGAYSIHDNTIPAGSPGLRPTSTATTRRLSTSWRGN
jgi:hypothetical protein